MLRRADLGGKDLVIDVVLQCRREESIRLKLMLRDRFGVQRVDNRRHDRDDALVDRGYEPGRPAALRSARDNKLIDLELAPRIACKEFLNRIKRANAALY